MPSFLNFLPYYEPDELLKKNGNFVKNHTKKFVKFINLLISFLTKFKKITYYVEVRQAHKKQIHIQNH